MAGEWKIKTVLPKLSGVPNKTASFFQLVGLLPLTSFSSPFSIELKRIKRNKNKNLNPFIYSFVLPLLAFLILSATGQLLRRGNMSYSFLWLYHWTHCRNKRQKIIYFSKNECTLSKWGHSITRKSSLLFLLHLRTIRNLMCKK